MRRFVVLLLCVGSIAIADEAVVPPDNLAFCSTCHGVQLMGNKTLGAPRLSDLPAWYIERQLRAYQAGWRGTHPDDEAGHAMMTMANSLSEEQLLAAARYVSATRSPLPAGRGAGDAERGRALYASCADCHGPDGEGNQQLGSPPLTGFGDWYLGKQLEDFRTGVRGSHPQDITGQQMRAAVAALPDQQAVADVVAYLADLRAKRAAATIQNDSKESD